MNFFEVWDTAVSVITNNSAQIPIPDSIDDFSDTCIKHFDINPTTHSVEIKVNIIPFGSSQAEGGVFFEEVSQLSVYVVVGNQKKQRISYEIGYRIASFIRGLFTAFPRPLQIRTDERNIFLEEIDGNKVSVCFMCYVHHDILG